MLFILGLQNDFTHWKGLFWSTLANGYKPRPQKRTIKRRTGKTESQPCSTESQPCSGGSGACSCKKGGKEKQKEVSLCIMRVILSYIRSYAFSWWFFTIKNLRKWVRSNFSNLFYRRNVWLSFNIEDCLLIIMLTEQNLSDCIFDAVEPRDML